MFHRWMTITTSLLDDWYPAAPIPGEGFPEVHNSIVQESVEVLTVVEDGHWQQTQEHYRFLALFDEADYIRISNSFSGTVIPETPFRIQSHRIGESYNHDFYLEKGTMCRGEMYDLRFTIRADSNLRNDARIMESSRAFHERTLSASFAAVFLGALPGAICMDLGHVRIAVLQL